jgi:hypothetical protein
MGTKRPRGCFDGSRATSPTRAHNCRYVLTNARGADSAARANRRITGWFPEQGQLHGYAFVRRRRVHRRAHTTSRSTVRSSSEGYALGYVVERAG